MIRAQMIRQDTRHPDKRRRHQGQASCEVAGHRFETQGPAPIYKLATLLWLHGHGGEHFEVFDDRDPFGKPGGLAMRGRVRNWARLVKGKPVFNKDASSEVDFSSHERRLVARAAGRVIEPAGENGLATARQRPYSAISPRGRPEHPQGQDRAPAAFATAPRPKAA